METRQTMARSAWPTRMRQQITTLLASGGLVVLLIGCGSRGETNLPGVSGADGSERGEWLCEAGKAADDWDCIQSENIEPILAERAAQRAKPPRTENTPQPTGMKDPTPQVLPQTPQPIIDPAASQRPTPVPEPPGASAYAAPLPQQPQPAERAAQRPSRPITTASRTAPDEPGYAQLAYRPADPVRIIDLPDNFFAAQLLAVSTKKQIEDFVVEQDLYNMSAARIEKNGSILYVLLLGVYESRDIAERAVDLMPNEVRTLKPWIRPINGLQDAMVRADRLVATAGLQ